MSAKPLSPRQAAFIMQTLGTCAIKSPVDVRLLRDTSMPRAHYTAAAFVDVECASAAGKSGEILVFRRRWILACWYVSAQPAPHEYGTPGKFLNLASKMLSSGVWTSVALAQPLFASAASCCAVVHRLRPSVSPMQHQEPLTPRGRQLSAQDEHGES
eukprot:6201745-Pleurochrysis_carterae.AAC.1